MNKLETINTWGRKDYEKELSEMIYRERIERGQRKSRKNDREGKDFVSEHVGLYENRVKWSFVICHQFLETVFSKNPLFTEIGETMQRCTERLFPSFPLPLLVAN